MSANIIFYYAENVTCFISFVIIKAKKYKQEEYALIVPESPKEKKIFFQSSLKRHRDN